MAKRRKDRQARETLENLSTDVGDVSTQEFAYMIMLNADLVRRNREHRSYTPLSGDAEPQDERTEELIARLSDFRKVVGEKAELFGPPEILNTTNTAIADLFDEAYKIAYLKALEERKGDI